MNKFTDSKLQEKISIWLSDPELKEYLKRNLCFIKDDETRADIETKEQFDEYIWKLWIDGSRWECDQNEALGDDYENYFYKNEFSIIDVAGECDDILVRKYCDNFELAKKCIVRTFTANNEIGDNFRLEMVTTPEDNAIIGWSLITD